MMLRGRRILGQTAALWRIDHDLLGGNLSRRLRTSLRASSRRSLRLFINPGRHKMSHIMQLRGVRHYVL